MPSSPMDLAYPKAPSETDENALTDELAASGFLRAYVGWASDQTDAPRLFHVGAGLLAIATMLGNRVWTRSWGNEIYPNLWLCLLAPSGFYRKSTSISYSSKMIAEVNPEMLLPRDFSREKLVGQLSQKADVLLISSEFGELLAKLTKDYMAGTKEMLTGLYDGEDYERKTQKESALVKHPAISILTASTDDWISSRVTAGDLRGGFLSRFLFLPACSKGKARGIGDGINMALRDDLIAGLRGRSRMTGEMSFRAVKPLMDKWIQDFEQGVNDAPDPRLMGFYSRAGLYLLKLAMCFQASELPITLEVSESAAHKAIRMWEFLAGNIREVITEQITTTRVEAQLKMVLDVVKAGGGNADYTTLLRQSRLLTKDLENILGTLIKSGQLEDASSKTRGRPKRAFRLARIGREVSAVSEESAQFPSPNGRRPQELVAESGSKVAVSYVTNAPTDPP